MAREFREGIGTLQSRLAWYISPDPHLGLPELTPLLTERCAQAPAGARLNLVFPMLVGRWFYGGMATAMRFFQRLASEFNYQRVIFTDQMEAEFDFGDWTGWVADRGEVAARSIAFLADRSASLSISPSDYFVATCWHTAVHVKHFVARQEALFGNQDRRFVYLIQDYEPSFYASSSRYVAARSTYSDGQKIIAAFNTQLLADYFGKNGFHFSARYVFEPMLNPTLREAKFARPSRKERMILVYGRPSIARNAFELLVEALGIWASSYPGARSWRLLSAGEPHDDIALSDGVVLESCGKLSTEDYASYLARSWAGVSLMLSPHPSYPPLEMAEFGAWVITNTFENKNLAELARNIISIDELSAAGIAERLAWCCDQYLPERASVLDELAPVFKSTGEEFPFATVLTNSWRQLSERCNLADVS